jgi:tetratricopeptide (TPR) repeat protein
VNFSFFYVCLAISIVPHEFGHFLAARWLGLRVFRVVIGRGRTLFKGRILDAEVDLKLYPFSGAILAAHREMRGYRWKQFLFVMAGPVANLALLLAAWAALRLQQPHFSPWRWWFNDGFEGWLVFASANAFLLLNLLPKMVRTELGMVASDGLNLFRALFGKASSIQTAHALWFFLEANASDQAGRREEGLDWLRRGLALYPDDQKLLETMGLRLFSSGDIPAARSIFVRLLDRFAPGSPVRAIYMNNVAFADALLGGEELLAEADRYSTEALAAIPWLRFVRNTRGTTLLFLGRVEEALPLLRANAEDPKVNPRAATECQCLLAIAEARRGDGPAATRHLEAARLADPACYLIARAEAEMAGCNAGKSVAQVA